MFHKSGFTLIEILVVILLIAIASALVAPVAHKSVEKFNNLLDRSKKSDVEKYIAYLSFVSDENCKLDNKTIKCGNLEYAIK